MDPFKAGGYRHVERQDSYSNFFLALHTKEYEIEPESKEHCFNESIKAVRIESWFFHNFETSFRDSEAMYLFRFVANWNFL